MNLVRKHLWLDLEDTVITPVLEGWWKTELINIAVVRDVIAEFKPDFLHIFSFAIWNETERAQFNAAVRPHLEAALGMEFTTVPTVDDDILPVCCKIMGLTASTVDFQEMSNFWGKHESFRLFMRSVHANTAKHGVSAEVMLLDDAVFNETFEWPDLQLRGAILNIDKL